MSYIYPKPNQLWGNMQAKGDSTSVNFKMQAVKAEAVSGRLLLLTPATTGWKEKIFEPTKERIVVSEEPSESDLPSHLLHNFKGSLVFQKCDEKWVVLNSGKAGAKFLLNGEWKNHLILEKGEKGFIANENGLLFLLIYFDNQGQVKKYTHEGKPNKGEFSLQRENLQYSYDKTRVCFIGKSAYCDWNCNCEADFAAAIYRKGREMWINVLDRKVPVVVNAVPVMEPRPLIKNSTITIAGQAFTYDFADSDEILEGKIDSGVESIFAERLVLIPATRNPDGSLKNMIYLPAPGKSVFVGRDPSQSQIVINSKTVSKKHAQIICYENMIMLLDCYSTNGTYVNGERISKRTVRPGDIIEFGDEKYILSYV